MFSTYLQSIRGINGGLDPNYGKIYFGLPKHKSLTTLSCFKVNPTNMEFSFIAETTY